MLGILFLLVLDNLIVYCAVDKAVNTFASAFSVGFDDVLLALLYLQSDIIIHFFCVVIFYLSGCFCFRTSHRYTSPPKHNTV